MTEIEQKRFEVLTKLKEILDELEVVNVMREPEELLPTHVLTTLHQGFGLGDYEVMGEFYFLPVEIEQQKFHYFNSMMTLDEEVPQEAYQNLALAINMLNFYLPAGSFVIEKNGGLLAYKYTSILPTTMETEKLISLIDGGMGMAMALTEEYIDALMQLLEGKITLEQFELELPDTHFME